MPKVSRRDAEGVEGGENLMWGEGVCNNSQVPSLR